MFIDEYLGPLTSSFVDPGERNLFDDRPTTLDPWAPQHWVRSYDDDEKDSDEIKDLVRGLADLPGAGKSSDVDITSPRDDIGTFNLGGWTSTVQNGRIEAQQLAPVGNTSFLMEAHAAAALAAMIHAARKDGVALGVGNTYRDYAAQVAAYDRYRSGSGALAAAPGTSNHGLGLAVDFDITPANHAWLAANAARFGFSNPFGTSYDATENWHWEFGQGGNVPSYGGGPPAEKIRKPKPRPSPTAPVIDPLTTAGLALDDILGGADPWTFALIAATAGEAAAKSYAGGRKHDG
jgi:hypothetical protein